MNTVAEPLGVALRSPDTLLNLGLPQWETFVRQARRTNLLPRFAVVLDDLGLLEHVPAAPRAHLIAGRALAQAQAGAVSRELAFVERALAPTGISFVVLKGAAYLLAGLPAARGRMFSDIDILVPRASLAQVEAQLLQHGWHASKTNEYDQRYYRQWMHELPPLKHVSRQTILDVHHAILPTTARLKPDSAKLLAASRPVSGRSGMRVLAPVDMVLHAATHLFCNEDVGNNLRDLVDLDSLLRTFDTETSFWAVLTGRATELNLARPLYYALRYAVRVLGTPVPDEVLRRADVGRPPVLLGGLMDELFLKTFAAQPVGAWVRLARGSLFVHAHWLRMPPHLLAYHLTVKALRPEGEK